MSVGLRKYIRHNVVEAARILEIKHGALVLEGDGGTIHRSVGTSWVSKNKPQVNGFLVVQDGTAYYVSSAKFLSGEMAVEQYPS